MNLQVILTGHGNFASGLASAASLIGGQYPNLTVVDFDGDFSAYEQKLEETFTQLAAKGEPVLFLVDVLGGSPFNKAFMLVAQHAQVEAEVLTGTNLPTLLDALNEADEYDSVGEFAKYLADSASTQFKLGSSLLQKQQAALADADDGI